MKKVKISAKNMERSYQPRISMSNPELKIQCSNSHCAAFNAVESRFCKRCKTPRVKRYLWAIKPIELQPEAQIVSGSQKLSGTMVGDRYFALTDRIVIDTKPGLLPQIPEELSPEITTYLKLSSYYPHIPQVYGQLDSTDIWLLDYGTVPLKSSGRLLYPQLIPQITFVWSEATPQRQLNWLLQIAKLWKPLQNKGVASTLLTPFLIKVNGSLLQLLQLKTDEETQPTLQQLGTCWSQLSQTANPIIHEILTQLCQRLENGSIDTIEQVIALLNRAEDVCSEYQKYSYQVFACSDSGPNRDNNEDAAYPVSENPINISQDNNSLAIVCDGVGGHDGGEIASQETIDYLQSRIAELPLAQYHTNPENILKKLTSYINEANDAISKRNDSEQRQERQRMGTTLVMTLARNHQVYCTHVGDSRIYWITKKSCHQITIDDDLASREVRLGYAVYRDALQYPSAGALIQALGMRDSAMLHPNGKHFVIDDDGILLLCSDGLSDFDRVEQYWHSIIVPVLKDQVDIKQAVQRLIKIANERNGHDNVTIALMYCKVNPKADIFLTPIPWSRVESAIEESRMWCEINLNDDILPNTKPFLEESPTTLQKTIRVARKSKSLWWKLILVGLIVSVSAGLLFYFLPEITNKQNPGNTSEQLDLPIEPDSIDQDDSLNP